MASEYDYKTQGDDMREIYPPDYQEWLDRLPEPTEEELKQYADEMEKTF